MFGTNHPRKEMENNGAEEIPTRVAEKIREQSKNLNKLTGVNTLGTLLPDLEPDKVSDNLAEVRRDNRYRDIKSVVASTDAVYLYSETYITENQAEVLIQAENVKARIAEKVREDSKNIAKLTGVDPLGTIVPGLEADKVEDNVAEVLKDERYRDIRSVVASTGTVYLYSETYITKSYADILVRVEANDPCATIAATVRDESRIYPRPTNIEFLKNPIFNIEPDELDTHIARTVERQDYKDIKLIIASTEARYLYSDLYMNEDYARSLVEWAEVGEEENP